jgi:hypothetical protein
VTCPQGSKECVTLFHPGCTRCWPHNEEGEIFRSWACDLNKKKVGRCVIVFKNKTFLPK